jgi:hypothetical protein
MVLDQEALAVLVALVVAAATHLVAVERERRAREAMVAQQLRMDMTLRAVAEGQVESVGLHRQTLAVRVALEEHLR